MSDGDLLLACLAVSGWWVFIVEPFVSLVVGALIAADDEQDRQDREQDR